VREALDGALFPLYTEAVEFQPLIELLAARAPTTRPLELAGLDHQLSAGVGGRHLLADLRSALGTAGLDAAASAALESAAPELDALFDEAYATGGAPVPPSSARRRFLGSLELLRGRFTALGEGTPPAAAEVRRWLQVLDNVETWARASWMMGRFDPDAPIATELHNLRDRQMAENLLWLVRQDPARKVVVWSLTVHLARDLDRLATGDETLRGRLGEMSAVGDLVSRELGDEAYSIAITAAEGSKGTPFREPRPLLAPTAGSFEDLMTRAGFDAAFVDLRREADGGHWLRRGLIAKPISYVELLAIWPRHLDGLLFVRTMQPARRVGASPR
jgi:erythromycin esterase-like protein